MKSVIWGTVLRVWPRSSSTDGGTAFDHQDSMSRGLAAASALGREAPAFAVPDDVSDRRRGEVCPKD
jgi:hypothetical protein